MIDEVADSPALRPPGASLRLDEVMGPAFVVQQDTTVRDVASLMLAQHVQGVLVVNASAEVVGVVTERQLTLDGHYLRLACIAARTLAARDVMERRLTYACSDEPVGAIVERMLRRDADYAVVHEGGSVVGMLGSADLLRNVAGEPRSVEAIATPRMNGQPVRLRNGRAGGSLINWLVGAWS